MRNQFIKFRSRRMYLPLSTTLPIFAGGAIKGLVERKKKPASAEEEELGSGNLFATGLVAGGAVAGVLIAFLAGSDAGSRFLNAVNLEEGLIHALSEGGYFALGVLFFVIMGWMLYRMEAKKKYSVKYYDGCCLLNEPACSIL